MSALTVDGFAEYFQAIHGRPPFPWQQRLLEHVVASGWPSVIDLPTASGKTAALDVAVYSMALTGRGPRRVFFVVDRRIVVDAAHERMQKIADALASAEQGILSEVADRLREMGGDPSTPLATSLLRGGIYRDDSWVRGIAQPLLVSSTVDQTGSRMLFRGYGVWDKTLPIHAALVANDSLILLDEAHCSRVFAETTGAVERYRRWHAGGVETPFHFTQMTATPAGGSDDVFRLGDNDLSHPVLQGRLFAAKPAELITSKARAKDHFAFAEDLVRQAETFAAQPGLKRIGIIVNRVKTARAIYARLRDKHRRTYLLIGRMRPADRVELEPGIRNMLSDTKRTPEDEAAFVVATQCLEVGADLDFDALVTECASIDALLQRFGRLDRIGELAASGIVARGAIMLNAALTAPDADDPIYGKALSATWNWLAPLGSLNFGICSADGHSTVREQLAFAGEAATGLRKAAEVGAQLLPAHLDQLAQTSPRPALEPDPALFLHGVSKGAPEVQVLWRADLDIDDAGLWAERVAMCPPVTAEAMPVPLREFRAWLKGEQDGVTSDIQGADAEEESDSREPTSRTVLRWRGDQSDLFGPERDQKDAGAIQPGDTFVIPVETGGWDDLGHIPENKPPDVAELARTQLQRAPVLRLHPRLIEQWWRDVPVEATSVLRELTEDPSAEPDDLRAALRAAAELLPQDRQWLRDLVDALPVRVSVDAYPAGERKHAGWVISVDRAEADSGQDESSSSRPVRLAVHLQDVARQVTSTAGRLLPDGAERESVIRAAELHDCGKADLRFQALLYGGDPAAARFSTAPRAKGEQSKRSVRVRRDQWRRSGLPDDFRHELISLLLAQSDPEVAADDLALHLIASHHGRCRPFAPVVDDRGEALSYGELRLSAADRIERAAHRLDSGVADRFWRLTRQYGWWGLAYLEALVRLGDWKASSDESEGGMA